MVRTSLFILCSPSSNRFRHSCTHQLVHTTSELISLPAQSQSPAEAVCLCADFWPLPRSSVAVLTGSCLQAKVRTCAVSAPRQDSAVSV
jgi:hypothetical protein